MTDTLEHSTRETRRAISPNTLITLKDACEIFFNGRITVATLKAEHARGNLDISKIGRAYFTTPGKLKAMDAKCLILSALANPLMECHAPVIAIST